MWDMKVGYEPILIPAALLLSVMLRDVPFEHRPARVFRLHPHMDSYTCMACPCALPHSHLLICLLLASPA